MNSNIRIGFCTNLIDGLKADWNPQSGKLDILYPVKKQAMDLKDIALPPKRGIWSYPDITLHENAASLLNELIPYQVTAPSSDADAPLVDAGALLCGAQGSTAMLDMLSKTIGVDLTRTDYRYALVKLRRIDGIDTHPSATHGILRHAHPREPDPDYGLHDDFISDSTRLPHAGSWHQQDYGDKLTQDDATTILNSFDQYGTHYVSAVEIGDTILQVFAYLPDKFATIKTAYAADTGNPLSGRRAQNFVQFTTDAHTGAYGFVEQYGKLICLSNADVFISGLRNGDWRDPIWSQQDSVFALFVPNAKLSLYDLQETFTEQAPISVVLASLGVMIEQKRGLLWQRIFKGAMVQKYRDSIQANFAIYDTRDFAHMLPDSITGLASNIATPTINIYKTRLDLASMQFVVPEEVNDFTVLANVLAVGRDGPVTIPGRDIALFAQVMDMRVSGQPRYLQLADDAFDSLLLGCDEFLGALVVRNHSGTRYDVIVDGLRFSLNGSGPSAKPVIYSDVRLQPPANAVPRLIDSIQYSMTFAEAVAGDQSGGPNDDVKILVRQYLIWLAKLLPSGSEDPEILALRVRALDLAHFAADTNSGAFVPILPYDDYQPYVQSILEHLDRIQLEVTRCEQQLAYRRQQELEIDVAQTLNKNIIESGKLISDVIDTYAAQQNDLEGYYDSLIQQKRAEADRQQSKLNELNAILSNARSEVAEAVEKYRTAVTQWRTMETIKFGLDVATNLFSLGTTIAIPASSISAVKDLGLKVQRIQKTLNVLNATYKLYSGTATGLKGLDGAQGALDALDGDPFGNPALLSWDELSIQFNEVMASGPDVKPAKAALQAAFSTMVLRGKAVASAESALHQIQRDIYANQLQNKLNTRQAARLQALQNKLKPTRIHDLDRSSIDLVGLTGQLSSIQNRMLTILAKAFLSQDQALQYNYLQPATPITSFNLLNFSAALVQQHANTIQAKSTLAPYQTSISTPIDYVIEGVLPEHLTNGNIYYCTICLDAPEFYQYVDVRILSVIASVEGIASTDSGNYMLRLAYNGSPFHDRNIDRNPLNFHTPSRERIYSYNVVDNSPTFADGGRSWSEGISRITPFSTWEISFPPTKSNQGLSFNRRQLTIKLSFVLEARIVDSIETILRRTAAGPMPRLAHSKAPDDIQARMLAAKALVIQPSREALLQQLFVQGSCTNVWDVVFNMGLEEINSSLKDQYASLKQDPSFTNDIDIKITKFIGQFTKSSSSFKLKFSYPLLNFSVNDTNTIKLTMEILSGEYQECSQYKDFPPDCTTITLEKGETLTADIKFELVSGEIKVGNAEHKVLQVKMNMAQGTFFQLSSIHLDDATQVDFNKEVKEYFSLHPIDFLINQLDLTNISTLDAMTPNAFRFMPRITPAGRGILQLYIMTGNRPLPLSNDTHLDNIQEPLPEGFSCSMIVRSGLVFSEVLPKSLRNNGWQMEGINPVDKPRAWSGMLTSGSVTGTIELSKLNRRETYQYFDGQYSKTGTIYLSYSMDGGNNVELSMKGDTLTVQPNGQLLFDGSHSQSLNYKQRAIYSGGGDSVSSHTADFTLSVRAAMPLRVEGSGRDQSIIVQMEGQSANVDGHLSGGGSCGSDDLEAQVNQQVKSQIPDQVKAKLSIQFDAISVFALKNLLFPSNNYISFSDCTIPGDLLLLGNFKKID